MIHKYNSKSQIPEINYSKEINFANEGSIERGVENML